MKARITVVYEYEINPALDEYPAKVKSWEAALEYDIETEALYDFGKTTTSELLGDPATEPWPGGES